MDRSEIKTEMINYKNYEYSAPFQSQVDSNGAFPNPNTLMFNIDPTCLLFNPFWPQMPFPVPSPFDGTTSAAGTAATVAPTEGDAAANAEEGKKPKRRRKRKRRRRRRRRNRRRKTKVVVQYVGVPMMPQIPGQFPMPMPFMPTPSGVLTQALFTEEAKATLAMHEDQPSTSEVFPEIKKLREQHIADLKREVSDSLTEYQARLKTDQVDGGVIFSRELLERHSLSPSPLSRFPSADSLQSDCESGESAEPEPLNPDELLKKFEESGLEPLEVMPKSVSAGFRSVIHEQAALAEIKALREAFDPFLVHISSSEGSDSPERESIHFQLQDDGDQQSVVSVRVDVDFEADSAVQVQVSLENDEGKMDICTCVSSQSVKWCYCRYCKKYPQLCGTDPDFSPPTPKRKGDAWVRVEGEEVTQLTLANLQMHDDKNNANVFGVFTAAAKDGNPLLLMISFLLNQGAFPHFSQKVATRIIHLIEAYIGNEEKYCPSETTRSRAPSRAISLATTRKGQWGEVKFSKKHFEEGMEELQVSKQVLEAWDASNAKHREICDDEREPTPDMTDCRPKIVLSGIPTYEFTIDELESMRRDRNDDLLWIAKKQAKSAVYKMLEANGVPRWLKYRVGIGAGWYGYHIRSYDRAFLTFDYCPEAFSHCERLVANGIITKSNVVKISWDQSPPKEGKNTY